MHWHVPPHSIALVFASALAVSVALVAWQRRGAPGSAAFVVLMLAVAEWAFMSALEKMAVEIPTKVLCAKIQYLGIASVPPLWLMFALGYSQRSQWLTRRDTAWLWIVPGLTIVLAATNEWHRLVWTSIVPTSNNAGALLVYHHGAWFWISAAYSYVLLLTGTLALALAIYRFPRPYRHQAVAVLIGLAIPWLSNAVYLLGLSPFPGLDLTPFAFTLTGMACVWGMFRLRLFDLVPVAHDAVIESMRDGVLVLDADNRIVDVNPTAQRMLSTAAPSPVGTRAEVVLAAWPDVVTHLRGVSQTQTEISLDIGGARHFDVRIAPLHDYRGRVTGRVIVLRDITERKQLEQMQEDLTHAMVHDLRNPLTSIIGSLEILAGEESPNTSALEREMRTIAQGNARRMLGLVDSILEVSRLESGQVPLERQPVQLNTLVDEAFQLQASLASDKRLQVVNAVPAASPLVLVDAGLVARVLSNLIDNAIKFTPEGGTIRVAARTQSPEQHLLVSVSDDGPGIPAAIRARLFQKFVSSHGPGGGSGLGLAFCRLVVEAHGGRISVEPTLGRGTTVTFTLPLAC